MNEFKEVSVNKAYRLINHGPTLLVSTVSENNEYDIAPIAWNCPAQKAPTRIAIMVGKSHMTYQNIESAGEFIACVPHVSQAEIVMKLGSASGRDVDKIGKFGVETFEGSKVKVRIPAESMGYLECRVADIIHMSNTGLIIGECVYAAAGIKAFDERVLTENYEGKSLHHLGGKTFAVPDIPFNVSS